jgi:LysM repeat protein
MVLNGLNSTNIYVGQRLKIESEKGATTTPVASTPSPANQVKYYTVQSGDTFGKIAQRHSKSISQLKQLNPGINIERLKLGQKIRVR